jgi:hypothetical protein
VFAVSPEAVALNGLSTFAAVAHCGLAVAVRVPLVSAGSVPYTNPHVEVVTTRPGGSRTAPLNVAPDAEVPVGSFVTAVGVAASSAYAVTATFGLLIDPAGVAAIAVATDPAGSGILTGVTLPLF